MTYGCKRIETMEAGINPIHRSEYNPYIDIAKFCMSILIVMIHVHPCEGFVGFLLYNVIARIADPMFFIITSYFFFRRVNKNGEVTGWKCLTDYLKRTIILYAIACALYSPQIINDIFQYNNNSLFSFFHSLIKKFLFSGPYGALWFLTALLTAIPLTFISTKYFGEKITLAVSFAFYLPAILNTSYSAVFSNWVPLRLLTSIVFRIFRWYANGLTFGFFFCSIGMYFAFRTKDGTRKKDIYFLTISTIALFAEALTLRHYKIASDYWALFFLTPVCFFLQKLLIDLNTDELNIRLNTVSKLLRNMSVIIFVFHLFFKNMLDRLLSDSCLLYPIPFFRFMLTLTTTILFAFVTVRLSHNRKFRFLRYLY